MSQRGRQKGPALSVADAMDRVRWDYTPSTSPAGRGRSAGEFFDDFPWQGTPDGEAEGGDADGGSGADEVDGG